MTPQGTYELHTNVMLISGLPCDFGSLRDMLRGAKVTLHRSASVRAAIPVLRQVPVPVVLVTSECDWRGAIEQFDDSVGRPAVVVLLPRDDPHQWAEALKSGAFEAISFGVRRDRLLWTVTAAYRRWERRQLVRAALADNRVAICDDGMRDDGIRMEGSSEDAAGVRRRSGHAAHR